MSLYIWIKYAHFISIFGMLSFLVAELVLIKPNMTRAEITILSKLDGFYGLMAILVVSAGLTLWFGVGKPADFYNNPVFHTKVGLAIIVGLISIIPTVFFIKQRKGDQEEVIDVPKRIKKMIILQLTILGLLPLLAIMMANGVRF